MCIHCARCGEPITAPYFFQGRPYGWTCIKFVNPTAKKERSADRWIIPQSHTLDRSKGKQQIVITHEAYKYVVSVRIDKFTNTYYSLDKNVLIGDNDIYINKHVLHD